MLRFLLSFLLICISEFVIAQQNTDQGLWHLTVVDSATAKGIDKVTVAINKKQYVTDKHGVIDIDKAVPDSKAPIRVTCVGYKSKTLLLRRDTEYPDTIRLSGAIIALKEVKVSTANVIELKLGNIKKSYNVHRVTSPGNSYAQFIPNDKGIKGTITSVEYVLNDELHGIEMPFRVRLFTKMKDSLTLDKELTGDSIIVYNPKKKRRVSVDVSGYNIQFPTDGVIAIFETLSPSYYSKDSVWHRAVESRYRGGEYIKTPGIDMDQTKNNWQFDYNKIDRKGPYSMVGSEADRWNWDTVYDQWYVYADGNNFAISITVRPD